MPRISLAFFTVAALCGLGGMGWGMAMGASHNFTMMPAHAHLNLVGWVTLSLMGGFYALSGGPASKALGWANFALSTLGLAIMIPVLTYILDGHEKQVEAFTPIGPTIAALGMLCFVINVLLTWRKPAPV